MHAWNKLVYLCIKQLSPRFSQINALTTLQATLQHLPCPLQEAMCTFVLPSTHLLQSNLDI